MDHKKGKTEAMASTKSRDGAPTRPLKGRRNPEEVQARILAAAISEFSEHSFSGARIERISRQAKTQDRMIYYYFGSKERLYQTVLEHVYKELISAQHDFSWADDDPVEGMRQLVLHSWRYYADHPELVRLLGTENLLRAKYLKKSSRIKSTTIPLTERIEELLEAGQKRGIFRSDADPQSMLMTVMSLGFFYVSNHYTCSRWLGVDLMEEERQEAWGRHICTVILDYLRAGAAG